MVNYMKSVSFNYNKSGFCILEFTVTSSGFINSPSVVWSTGAGFEDTAFSILSSMKYKSLAFFQGLNSSKVRLPIFFKSFNNLS